MAEWSSSDIENPPTEEGAPIAPNMTSEDELTEQMFELSSQQLYEEGIRIITNMQTNLMSQLQEDSLRSLINQANVLLADVGDRLRTFNHILSHNHPLSGRVQPHVSCKSRESPKNEGMLTRKRRRESGVRQEDLKCRFPQMSGEEVEFFNSHSCCVCMETYREVVEGDHHIVAPSCGHPLCCKCADGILARKPECPICKVKVDQDSFEMVKFGGDLRPDLKKQKLYL